MTSALEQEAVDQGAVEMPPFSSIEFSPSAYQKVVVYLSGNEAFDDQQIRYALARYWHGHVRNAKFATEVEARLPATPPQQSTAGAQRPQQSKVAPRPPQARQQRGQNEYPPANLVSTLDNAIQWTCNKCGGTGEGVARRLQKGAMKSDAIVCLNPACKEGDFRYTLAWDDGTHLPESAEGNIDPDDLPF